MVLDASVTVAWAYAEETTPEVTAVFVALSSGEIAWVPSRWSLEIANVLTVNIARRKNDLVFRNAFLEDMRQLDIRVDSMTAERAWGETLRLTDQHNLTPYDASYLELAIRLKQSLATLDRDLRKAAALEGIPLLPL